MEDKAGQTGRVASEQVLIFISGLNSGAKKRQESIQDFAMVTVCHYNNRPQNCTQPP